MTAKLLGPADTLDRQSNRRSDIAYLADLANRPDAQFMLLQKLDPIVHAQKAALSLWFTTKDHTDGEAELGKPVQTLPTNRLFLGIDKANGTPYFALRDGDWVFGNHISVEPATDLRTLASTGSLPAAQIALAGLARSLFAWHDSAHHCGWCGSLTTLIDGGWKRTCTPCAKDTFPRLDPVVIMLVTDGERCVLAHEPRYPLNMFSTIAGYLEPGEDIAHAVARETYEELGVTVTSVTFQNSQPWPFPHSLMIGCIAHCAPTDLNIDLTELVAARWFTREEATAMLAGTHPKNFWVPGPQAIAHHLIQGFVEGR